MKLLKTFILLMLVAACTPVPTYKPGVSQEEFNRDRTFCLYYAQKKAILQSDYSVYGLARDQYDAKVECMTRLGYK